MGAGMKIDIDRLTEAELIDLNNRIVERLRLLSQMRAHGQMLQFKIGDRQLGCSARLRPQCDSATQEMTHPVLPNRAVEQELANAGRLSGQPAGMARGEPAVDQSVDRLRTHGHSRDSLSAWVTQRATSNRRP